MGSDGEKDSRDFYRVACELQIRFRKADADEVNVFKEFGLRPSPYSNLRTTIETELNRSSLSDEAKMLLEKGFQILLNIDQRLERLEELIQSQHSDEPIIQESHEWVHADVSAGGIAFVPPKDKSLKVGDLLMIDMIFPSLPEQRVVCSGKVLHAGQKDGTVGIVFESIHQDDKEFIHRFVLEREREILRARALEREKPKA
jgi:hypothetical protein